jgi:uncharacterized protein YyaL (SSP411 family)
MVSESGPLAHDASRLIERARQLLKGEVVSQRGHTVRHHAALADVSGTAPAIEALEKAVEQYRTATSLLEMGLKALHADICEYEERVYRLRLKAEHTPEQQLLADAQRNVNAHHTWASEDRR